MAHLRAVGVETTSVVEAGLQGATDRRIVEFASERGLTVLTQDLDFGRIFVESEPQVQIVVLRSHDPRPVALRRIVDLLLKAVDLDAEATRHALVVVGEHGCRIRHRVR